nr:ATP synthase F0 subunit 8 [Zoodes fulguratus]
MPQMAPLNWLTLFIYFLFIYFLFNTLNFFSSIYKVKKFESGGKKLTYNWKW